MTCPTTGPHLASRLSGQPGSIVAFFPGVPPMFGSRLFDVFAVVSGFSPSSMSLNCNSLIAAGKRCRKVQISIDPPMSCFSWGAPIQSRHPRMLASEPLTYPHLLTVPYLFLDHSIPPPGARLPHCSKREIPRLCLPVHGM